MINIRLPIGDQSVQLYNYAIMCELIVSRVFSPHMRSRLISLAMMNVVVSWLTCWLNHRAPHSAQLALWV